MLALCRYWQKFPPAHVILAAVHMEKKDEPKLNKAEEDMLASKPEGSFDNLPVEVQDALMKARKRG